MCYFLLSYDGQRKRIFIIKVALFIETTAAICRREPLRENVSVELYVNAPKIIEAQTRYLNDIYMLGQ